MRLFLSTAIFVILSTAFVLINIRFSLALSRLRGLFSGRCFCHNGWKTVGFKAQELVGAVSFYQNRIFEYLLEFNVVLSFVLSEGNKLIVLSSFPKYEMNLIRAFPPSNSRKKDAGG